MRMENLECKRCSYEWIQRTKNKPERCPNCRAYRWWEEKKPKAPDVTFICDFCGKEKTVRKGDFHGKVFHTCSKSCQYALLGDYLKQKWALLTPGQQKERIDKIQSKNGGSGGNTALVEYHKKKRPERVAKALEIMTTPVPKTPKSFIERYAIRGKSNKKIRKGNPSAGGVCATIEAHHEMLKNDPERLSTEFIQTIVGKKCDTDKTES
jgi:hypothetical protein